MNIKVIKHIGVMFCCLSNFYLTQTQASTDNASAGPDALKPASSLLLSETSKDQARNLSTEEKPEVSDLLGYALSGQKIHGSIPDYQKKITSIEDLHGVYDIRLSKQLTGLGLAYHGQGEHGAAIDSFKRAIHISRINGGLYGLEQAPILTHLVDSYVASEDWDNAHDKQYLLLKIKRHNYGADSPKLLGLLSKMVDWHLGAFQKRSKLAYLVRASELNRHLIDITEKSNGRQHVSLSDALYKKALVSRYLAELQFAANGGNQVAGLQFAGTINNPDFVLADQDRQHYAQLSPYRDGKQALQRRVQIYKNNPEASVAKKVDAIVHLGDWYFYFNKRNSAIKTYGEALQLLASSDGARGDIERVFGQPHALRFSIEGDTLPKKKEDDADKQQGFVKAEFEITSLGKARDIKIVDSNPPNMMDSLVRKSIQATRYRPRLIDGKPVLTKGVVYRHAFTF